MGSMGVVVEVSNNSLVELSRLLNLVWLIRLAKSLATDLMQVCVPDRLQLIPADCGWRRRSAWLLRKPCSDELPYLMRPVCGIKEGEEVIAKPQAEEGKVKLEGTLLGT